MPTRLALLLVLSVHLATPVPIQPPILNLARQVTTQDQARQTARSARQDDVVQSQPQHNQPSANLVVTPTKPPLNVQTVQQAITVPMHFKTRYNALKVNTQT